MDKFWPYDIEDPLDKPEFPYGLVAISENGDRHEIRHKFCQYQKYSTNVYCLSCFWIDKISNKFLGKPLDFESSLLNAIYYTISIWQAEKWIEEKAEEYRKAGWTVKMI